MNKKVLFVHDGPRWKDEMGTQFGTTVDLDLYHRYLYLGETVEFAMRVFPSPISHRLVNLNESGLYINEIIPFNRPALIKNYYKSRKEIIKQVDLSDILVIRLPSTIGSVALNYAHKIKKPYIVEVVVCPWDTLRNHSWLGKLYAIFSKNKLKSLVKKAPYVNYVTKEFLQERYPTPNYSIGLSDVIIKNMPSKNLMFDYYESANFNRIRISTLGAVNLIHKGHSHVLEAISILKKEGLNIIYSLVGGGDNSRLKTLVSNKKLENHVEFLGKVPHDDVFDILDNTDIYIQPSEAEGLPRALVEAMSRGCACICSDAGGMPELLDSRVVFKSKDVDDLVSKIKYLLDKQNLIEQSRINFEKAKEYRFDVLEKKRRDFYDKFLSTIHEK